MHIIQQENLGNLLNAKEAVAIVVLSSKILKREPGNNQSATGHNHPLFWETSLLTIKGCLD